MNTVFRQILIELGFLLPTVAVVWVILRKHAARRAKAMLPIEELRRRPAGEGLRIKIEELNDEIASALTLLLIVPLLAGGVVSTRPNNWWAVVFLGLVATAWAAGWGVRLYRLTMKRSNYLLGFDGERYVAEELSRLIAQGFEVFHDVPFDGFNVDHVLVGKRGVFVVETKTRRKPVNEKGRKRWEVEFDGSLLHWPMGPDAHGIEQARRNASTVAQWLSKTVGEPISVNAVLTLPGWWVERKAPCRGVDILNPKEIGRLCAAAKEVMSDSLVHRVVYQLEQRCALRM